MLILVVGRFSFVCFIVVVDVCFCFCSVNPSQYLLTSLFSFYLCIQFLQKYHYTLIAGVNESVNT